MNWTVAAPELALALCAMAILLFGVIRKQDSTFLCTMLGLGAMLLTVVLVIGGRSAPS
jgi:NADH-quinone oxidoreductase subunit N